MKNFKLISIALVICMLAALLSCFAVNAEQASDYCIADLRFSEDNTRGNIELNGAHIVEEDVVTGAVTIELDEKTATINMVFAENFFKEGDGGNIYYDCPINVKDTEKHPYFVFDYASADDVVVSSMIAHYTRKDKAETSALGDLYLNSMMAADYVSYQMGGTDCNYFNGADGTTSTVAYGIWDWGKYVTGSDAKVFDDGIHRFCDVTCTLTGSVGKRLTFYKFGVYSTTDNLVLQLGFDQPEATPDSGDTSDESSEPEDPETPVLNVIKPSFNTTITAGATTIITNPADGLASYNVRWCARILLAPTETAGVYTVVQIQTPDGTDDPTFSELNDGYIVLAIHGDDSIDNNSESVQIRNAWMALEAGTTVTFEGYDFEALTVADDATVSFEAASPDESSQPDESSEPDESSDSEESKTDESSQPEESKTEESSKAEESSKTEETEGGSFPWWIIVVVAVVVIAVVVFIVIKKKK